MYILTKPPPLSKAPDTRLHRLRDLHRHPRRDHLVVVGRLRVYWHFAGRPPREHRHLAPEVLLFTEALPPLQVICIFFKRRQARLGIDDFGRPISSTVEVVPDETTPLVSHVTE